MNTTALWISRSAARLGMAAILIAVGPRTFAQNLLENGSFELGNGSPGESILWNASVDNWTSGGAGIGWFGTVLTAADGQFSVAIHRIAPGWVQQSFPTVTGQTYRVTFAASANVWSDGSGGRLVRGKATLLSSGTAVALKEFSHDATGKRFPSVGWTPYSFDFTGPGGSVNLRFDSLETGNSGPVVDNVRVLPGSDDGNGNWILNGAPVFVSRPPKTVSVATGGAVTLQVEAAGAAPLRYQWYRAGFGSTYTAVAGATAATYEIPVVQTSNAGKLSVVVSNSLGAVTNLLEVRVVTPPQISGQPQEQRVSVGGQLSISLGGFSGSPPDRFQWHKDGQPIPGATESSYIKNNVQLADAGLYHADAFNLAGSATSEAARVTVLNGPVPPWLRPGHELLDTAAPEGSFLNLQFNAEGSAPLNYHWLKDGQPIAISSFGSFSKPNAQTADSGSYSVIASNVAGIFTSRIAQVTVYPPQQAPRFSSSFYETNATEGGAVTLAFTLAAGTHVRYQWFMRPENVFIGMGDPIPNATNIDLLLANLSGASAGTYTLQATNFVGQASGTAQLRVLTTPRFTAAPRDFEGAVGATVNLSASVENFSPDLTWQWRRNGQPISGATQSGYNFVASLENAGSYTVVARNAAGETESAPAIVAVYQPSPSPRSFTLVADRTIPVPERTAVFFNVVGDATLRNGVVTFQSTPGHPDVGGLYRWQNGLRTKLVDLNTTLPSLNAFPTVLDGVSAEADGTVHFLGSTGNDGGDPRGLFAWHDGTLTLAAGQMLSIPGKASLTFKRFGYPTRAGGKTAFLFQSSNVPDLSGGGYRGVAVLDGGQIQVWADSDETLPAGDGVWFANSSQVGFDGSTLAFWAVDQSGSTGTRSGIFATVNGAPLQKLAFTGDPIPGGLGTFQGFNSPPRVHGGKVLFFGSGQEPNQRFLLEHANGALRVVAKSGDTPQGASSIENLQYGFDYAADGSILFSASGPGTKQGIYRWKDGVLAPELTTLNTIDGRLLRLVSLYDADGADYVIAASFNGTHYGLYLTANIAPAAPRLVFTRTSGGLTVSWDGSGTLEQSANLNDWSDRAQSSPQTLPYSGGTQMFYRVRR